MKRFFSIFLLSFFSLILIGLSFCLYLNSSPEGNKNDAIISIAQGKNFDDLAHELADKKMIRSALFFKALVKISGNSRELKKGNYKVPKSLSSVDLMNLFTTGQERLKKVTIPDGYTLTQIAKLFEKENICSAKDFMAAAVQIDFLKSLNLETTSAEGYLFPETYYFSEGYPAPLVIKKLHEQWRETMASIDPNFAQKSPSEIHQIITLASIVEREYVVPEEAPLIASVFENRLAIGKALQSCATVVYVITEELKKPHPSRIFFKDLEVKSSYNTYLNKGLPPGPISNPGSVALRAALYPAKSDYLYFVVKDPVAKKHYFSKTYSEHEEAISLFLK